MPWSRPLKPPLTLKDAADLLLGLSEIQRPWPSWTYAAELLKGRGRE
jgi:hypothetical protein